MVDMTVSTKPVKTESIKQDAADKNVAANVVYLDGSNDLFYDAACTKAVAATDCLNLFLKGVVGVKNSTYYKAVSCTSAGVISFGL